MNFGGKSNLDNLVDGVTQLVSLPDVYYRLESLADSPTATMDDFSRLLSTEPDLCARLLSLANSAFYSFPASIESVDKAVQIIGIRRVRELVLATTVMQVFNQVPLGMVNMRLFWEHSVAVGVFAKSIAVYCKQMHVERYYVAGLLHNIGRLMFYIKLPGVMHDLLIQREAREEILHSLELETLGYSNAEAGARLLEVWKVPESIFEPIRCYHQPDSAMDYITVTSAVHIADVWVNRNQIGGSGERYSIPLQTGATQTLGIEEYELDELWEMTVDDIHSVINQFLAQ